MRHKLCTFIIKNPPVVKDKTKKCAPITLKCMRLALLNKVVSAHRVHGYCGLALMLYCKQSQGCGPAEAAARMAGAVELQKDSIVLLCD
jgi:hypothetical protein